MTKKITEAQMALKEAILSNKLSVNWPKPKIEPP
jgi:hypothetical protein